MRNGSAFPLSPRITLGCALTWGLFKSVAGVRGVKRKIIARLQRLGDAARFKVASVRKGRAIPHNRRRSRVQQRWFGCGSVTLCNLCVLCGSVVRVILDFAPPQRRIPKLHREGSDCTSTRASERNLIRSLHHFAPAAAATAGCVDSGTG